MAAMITEDGSVKFNGRPGVYRTSGPPAGPYGVNSLAGVYGAGSPTNQYGTSPSAGQYGSNAPAGSHVTSPLSRPLYGSSPLQGSYGSSHPAESHSPVGGTSKLSKLL